jgi:hypothetical protein
MYKDTLKKLREQVFAPEENSTPTKSRSFIQARVESRPLEDAKVTPYADWLKTISSMASDLKASTQKQQEASGGGFAAGLASSLDIGKKEESPDPVENVPEENREAFIRKRGDGPSYYAPRASKEQNSHEARINATNGGFKDLIDKHEGGGDYDTLYQFSNKGKGRFSNVKITEMTIGELKDFANGEYGSWSKQQLGYKATPMGRYQFVGSTMAEVARQMGLPDDTVFSPSTQDAMFDFWVGETLAKGDTMGEKVSLLRGQWEGFKNVPRSTLESIISKYGA